MNGRIIVAAIAVIAIVAAGLWGYLGNRVAGPSDIPGRPIVDVTVPELTEAQLDGKFRFDRFCAGCHGDNAAGQEEVAPPLVHIIYEPSHHADGAFFFAAMNGVRSHHWPFGNMPPVEGITEEDVAAILQYVRALQRANGID